MEKLLQDSGIKESASSLEWKTLYVQFEDALGTDDIKFFYRIQYAYKLLYLAKRIRPDLQPVVNYLTRGVHNPKTGGLSNLWRVLIYLNRIRYHELLLQANINKVTGNFHIRHSIVACALYEDTRSQIGSIITLGQSVTHARSVKTTINIKIWTESELVGLSYMIIIGESVWLMNLLRSLDFTADVVFVQQGSKSTIHLVKKNMWPIRYFYTPGTVFISMS